MGIKEILQEWREEGVPKDLLDRDLNITIMPKKANSFVGIRRAGKTYTLFQIIKNKIKSKNVFYINMEDDRIMNPNIKHLSDLLPIIRENFKLEKKPIYLFVDEIQNVADWEKWAKRIAEKENIMLFVSGSSSKLSSREIATALRGRTITNYIFPLNFKEFLRFMKFNYDIKNIAYSSKRFELKRLFKKYLFYGGFPEVVLQKGDKEKLKLLKEYFATIIARDVIERFKIGNIVALESFMKLLLNTYSRSFSFSKAQKWLNSIGIKVGKATLIDYFNYLKQSFFIFNTEIFSYKVKERLQYPRKIYITDNGFITALAEKSSGNIGWFYENLVAIELFKNTVDDPAQEFFYWKSQQYGEVDFVLKHGMKVKQLIQVCYNLEDEKTKKREMRALLKASEELKCTNLLVITGDYEAEEKVKGKKIKFTPLWKWLLI